VDRPVEKIVEVVKNVYIDREKIVEVENRDEISRLQSEIYTWKSKCTSFES